MTVAASPDVLSNDSGDLLYLLGEEPNRIRAWLRYRDFLGLHEVEAPLRGFRTEAVRMSSRCCPNWNDEDHVDGGDLCESDGWDGWWTEEANPNADDVCYTKVYYAPPEPRR